MCPDQLQFFVHSLPGKCVAQAGTADRLIAANPCDVGRVMVSKQPYRRILFRLARRPPGCRRSSVERTSLGMARAGFGSMRGLLASQPNIAVMISDVKVFHRHATFFGTECPKTQRPCASCRRCVMGTQRPHALHRTSCENSTVFVGATERSRG